MSSKGNSAGRTFVFSLLLVFFGIFADQVLKYLSVCRLKGAEGISIIPGVLELYYLENRGMAFGMLENRKILFLLADFIISALLLCFLFFMPADNYYFPLRVSVVFMISGALGNMLDRIHYGFVIDYIYISLIDFPVFNLADIFVVAGTLLLVVLVLFRYQGEQDFDFIRRI